MSGKSVMKTTPEEKTSEKITTEISKDHVKDKGIKRNCEHEEDTKHGNRDRGT